MSLDLLLIKAACDHCGRDDEVVADFNYTYNVSIMWHEIYPNDRGMVYIDGMTGKEAYPKIRHALERLIKEPEIFEKLNPKNGWGSYEGFVIFLTNIGKACLDYPNLIWESCR